MKQTSVITAAAFCTLALGGCQPTDQSDAEGTAALSATAASDPQEHTTGGTSPPGYTPSVRDASTDAVPVVVPLTPGVYIVEGASCENPANAAWRIWDGKGLSGSATRACRAEVLSHSGDTFRLRNSCQNTYDGSRTDETLTITITDQVHFTTEGVAFSSCSTAQVPAALRRRLTDVGRSSTDMGQRQSRDTADTPES